MVGCIVQAQMPQLLPKPQKVSFTGKYVKAGVPVRKVEQNGAEAFSFPLLLPQDGMTVAA